MDSRFKYNLIKGLTTEIKDAGSIKVESIADSIQNIGFSCRMCGKCCRREYGENSVIVFPEEIKKICLYTDSEHSVVAKPPLGI